ncbi:MAG: hypothetical protein ACYCVB_08705 [Bacilli bacterium]
MNPERDGQQANPAESITQSHGDIEEGVDRMADEGGGVVDQHSPSETPILRNDLVRPSVGD